MQLNLGGLETIPDNESRLNQQDELDLHQQLKEQFRKDRDNNIQNAEGEIKETERDSQLHDADKPILFDGD